MSPQLTRIGELLGPEGVARLLGQLEAGPRPSELRKAREGARSLRKKKKRRSRSFQRLERAAVTPTPPARRQRTAGSWIYNLRNALEDTRSARRSVSARGSGVWFRQLDDVLRNVELSLSPLVRELEPIE